MGFMVALLLKNHWKGNPRQGKVDFFLCRVLLRQVISLRIIHAEPEVAKEVSPTHR
jgi:hypothetical protein